MNDASDFIIENGILTMYQGPGGNVTIPEGVTDIADNTFEKCESLTSVVIPDGVTTIGCCAFSGCRSLTEITLPEELKEICWGAFQNCDRLSSITIPDSVTSISPSAFLDTAAASINDPSEWEDGVLYTGNVLIKADILLGGDYTVKSGIKCIAANAFEGCDCLTSVIIPEGVISIGDYAFCGCSSLTEIALPEGLKEIGEEAFLNCASLECLKLPNSLTEIHSASFYIEGGRSDVCDIGLTEFYVHEDHPAFSVIDGILYSKDRSELILCPIGKMGEVLVPDGVIRIGESAFDSCKRLQSITLPESLIYIGKGAFQGCSELQEINLPGNLVDIDEGAFFECHRLSFSSSEKIEGADTSENDIIIPRRVKHIGDSAFWEVAFDLNLEKIAIFIPESVTDIGEYVFENIGNLPYAKENRTIYGISGSAAEKYADDNKFCFEPLDTVVIKNCILTKCRRDQENVIVPEGVTGIGNRAFENCCNLTEITLPSSVTSIGDHAFHNCSKLAVITIPESVTDFGEDLFWGCKELFREKAAKAGTNERFLHDDASTKLEKAMALFTSCVERVEKKIREDGEYGQRPVVSDRTPSLQGKIVRADTDCQAAAEFFEKVFEWMRETGMGGYESEITPEHVKAWLNDRYKELTDGNRYWFGGAMGIRYPVALAVAYQIYVDPDSEIEIEFAKSKWDYRGDYKYSARVCLMMYHYGDSVFVGYNE